MQADLQQFIRTGIFESLNFGLSRQEVESILGAPTLRGAQVNGREAFWQYGDVQLHWNVTEDGRLHFLHIDLRVHVPEGGPITIDPWVICRGLPRERFQEHLTRVGILFGIKDLGEDFGVVRVSCGVGVVVTFNEGDDDEPFPKGMLGLSYSAWYPAPPKHHPRKRSARRIRRTSRDP